MIYLASPYSVRNPDLPETEVAFIKEARYRKALACLAHFTNKGLVMFSPIVHSHPMSVHHTLPGDWQFWERVDREFISVASELWILTIDDWHKSIGISEEMKIAMELNKPIFTVSEDYVIEKL